MKSMRTLVEAIMLATIVVFVLRDSLQEADAAVSSLNLGGTCIQALIDGLFWGGVISAVVVGGYDVWKRDARRGREP